MPIKLNQPNLIMLNPNEIQPQGWLLQQLKIQANGLSGHLDEFWPDIAKSQWIGGTAEGWERVPYWLDGFIPLAWLIKDIDMQTRATRYINYIISHQEEDGWICPVNNQPREHYDVWATFLILKVLVLYHDFTQDSRIETIVKKALISLDKHIDGSTLFNWAQTRWFEALISIWWLYERQPEQWILDLVNKLSCQGFDWQKLFANWPYKKIQKTWNQMSHVVNNAMMLKSGALQWRLSGDKSDLESAESMLNQLMDYHGMVTGVFTGDECLAGKSPIHGTELCAVAELMYSYETLLSISGQAKWGDRLEKVAFNALPATFSPDMWTHQYDQQVNQVQCTIQEVPIFNTNSGEAHLFGLEPNYGCCTANLSQPWPKFALSTFMKNSEGFVSTVLAPCTIQSTWKGVGVKIQLETDYPFKDSLSYTIETDEEIEFALTLRIPEWSTSTTIYLDDQVILVESGFYSITRPWKGTSSLTVNFTMQAEVVERPNELFAIVRGPLVYSLPLHEEWVQINKDKEGHEFPHCDYEILPQTNWNYGLNINPKNCVTDVLFEENSLGTHPFSPDWAPIKAIVYGQKIEWPLVDGSATLAPSNMTSSHPKVKLTLIPYGCTNLRITELPII